MGRRAAALLTAILACGRAPAPGEHRAAGASIAADPPRSADGPPRRELAFVVTDLPSPPRTIAVDDAFVWWTLAGESGEEVWRAPKGGGPAARAPSGARPPSPRDRDGQHAYRASLDSGGVVLRSADARDAGPGDEVLTFVPRPRALAVDERDVFVATPRAVVRFAKEPTRAACAGDRVALPGACARATKAVLREAAACRGDDAGACGALSERLYGGRGLAVDVGAAAALRERACALGDVPSCAREAALSGRLAASCERGDARACAALSGLSADLTHAREHSARALSLWEAACAGGDAAACLRAGAHVDAVTPINPLRPPDDRRSRSLYEQSCRGGDDDGCFALAFAEYHYTSNKLVTHGPFGRFEALCERGHMPACRHAAGMSARGEGTHLDRRRAVELRRTACEGGDLPACRELMGD